MTSLERDLLRQAIDAARRARIQQLVEEEQIRVCSRCGIETDCVTPGCKTCWNRRRERQRREEPGYKAVYEDRRRRRRRRRRLEAAAAAAGETR